MAELKAFPYALPLKTRYRWAKGDHDSRCGILIRVDLEGAVGWGEIAYGPHVVMDWRQRASEVERLCASLSLAEEDLPDQLDRLGLHNRDRCGIATAWFCARAALKGETLAEHLSAGKVPATSIPINGLINKDRPEDVIAQARGYAAQGMSTFKVKCFADVTRDLERIRALRDAFPNANLRLDPNDAWQTVEDALRNMEALAGFGIDYVEDPLNTTQASLNDMAELRRADPAIPLAWDNPVENISVMERLLDLEAVDVFIFKMPRAGGPDRQLDMINCAAEAGKLAVMTGPLETAVGTMAGHHISALLPQPLPHCGFSLSEHFAQDIADLSPVKNGERMLPATPGLGIKPVQSRLMGSAGR